MAARLRLAATCARATTGGATLPEAAPQALHQIHHLRLARFGAGLQMDLLAFQLALNDPHEVFAVLVGVLRRIPFRGEAIDERLRHVELRLADVLGGREI